MKTEALARGAFSVALCIVFLLLFRGTASLLNAILIPTVLFVSIPKSSSKSSSKSTPKSIRLPALTAFFGLITIAFFFFMPQIFFVIFYCLAASFLLFLWERLNKRLICIILSIVNFAAFIIIIKLTDQFFSVGLWEIYLKMAKGNQIAVYLILLALGAIAGIGATLLSGALMKRIKFFRDI